MHYTLDERLAVVHEQQVGELIMEIDGDAAVLSSRFGALSHVSPLLRRSSC